MPKDIKTLGNNKARACESLGFVHKKRLCQRFDTTSFVFLMWFAGLRIVNQYHRICHIAKYHNTSFYTCNRSLGKEQSEQPEQNAGTYQCEQIEVGNSAEVKGSDAGTAS